MKQLMLTFLLALCAAATAAAGSPPAVIFSQEVVAIDRDGHQLPQVEIDPQSLTGMHTYDFQLGQKRLLRVETNISDAAARGLDQLAATVRRCYDYVETATGRQLDRGALLYLIELDELPTAYRFQASYQDASQWGEVRLVMIDRGAPLAGREAPAALTDLLYDTLPHELGHDLLADLAQLRQDIDGRASHHTRWFTEGVCEVLAKGFSLQEDRELYRRFLTLRSVDTVLAEERMTTALLRWAQDSGNGMVLESDLYGAAMLTMMVWNESVPLDTLLGLLTSRETPVGGTELVAILEQTTGHSLTEIFARAHAHGSKLNDRILLAKLEPVAPADEVQ